MPHFYGHLYFGMKYYNRIISFISIVQIPHYKPRALDNKNGMTHYNVRKCQYEDIGLQNYNIHINQPREQSTAKSICLYCPHELMLLKQKTHTTGPGRPVCTDRSLNLSWMTQAHVVASGW